MSIIKKPQDIEAPNSVKALIYGQPGIGKTTLTLSAPSPLLIDFDGGVHRVRPDHLTDTVQVRSWKDIEALLSEDLSAYRTLVIDTAGKMLDYMGSDIITKEPKMGRGGSLTLQGYGVRKGMFQSFVGRVSTMGKHLVFVAHDREEKDGDSKIVRPEIGGSSSGDLIKELDLVGYMEASGKKRTISFDPCEKFYGKNTCGMEALTVLPDLQTQGNKFLSTVFDRFVAAAEVRKGMMGQYTAIMDGIRRGVDAVADADGANDFVKWVADAGHIWDSKIHASHLLRDKAKEIGLTFSQTEKVYKGKAATVAA